MYYLVMFIAIFCGSLFGSAIVGPYTIVKFEEMKYKKTVRKIFAKFEKEIRNMSDEELGRRLSAYYDWKERIDDDLK